MKKKAYILVGNGRIGKSASIRCLTGTYQTTIQCTITTQKNRDITLYVQPRSMQEAQMDIASMMAVLNGYYFCLISLRLAGWLKAPDSADAYIDALLNDGWDIQIVYMDDAIPPFFGKFHTYSSLHLPRQNSQLNVIASFIRTFFDWI